MNAAAAALRAATAVGLRLTPEEMAKRAWQLCQTDTAAALALADAAQVKLAPDAWAERARLQLVRAEACWLMGDLSACEALVAAADAGFARADDRRGQSDAAAVRAHAVFDGGDFGAARASMQAALSLALSAGDAGRGLQAQAVLAYWSLVGDFDAAERTWGPFVAAQQHGSDPWLATWAHDVLGQVHARRGNQTEAIAAFSRCHALALQSGQVRRAIVACSNVAASFCNLNVHEPALEWIDKGLQLARPGGWPASLGLCLMMMGNSHFMMGRYAAARAALEEAVAVMQPLPGSRSLLLAQYYMGDVLLKTGDAKAAATVAAAAKAEAERAGMRDFVADCERALAEALLQQGLHLPAREAAERALHIAETQGSGNRRIDALIVLARVHTAVAETAVEKTAADHRASLDCLMQALRIGDEIEGFVHEPGTLELAARAFAEAGDFVRALHWMQRANTLRDREDASLALDRAIAMEVHHATARASAEAAALLERTAAQARRSALLKESNATLRKLAALGQDITAQSELDAIFVRMHRHLSGLLDAPHLSVWLVDMPAGALHLRFGMEQGERIAAPSILLDDPASPIARCVREEREGHERRDGLHPLAEPAGEQPAWPGAPPASGSLLGPLRVRGRLIGVLSIQSQRADAYGERERLVLRSFCAWAAIAIDNVAVVSQLDTARRQLQAASDAERRARERAEQATALKGEFLASISHDLRTPLASLHGYLETLLLGPSQLSDADRSRYLCAALAQSAKVNRLAGELGARAQLESGQPPPALRAFALPELLVDVVRKLELSAVARSQRMRLHLGKPLPAALADHCMIDRVLTNVLDNAIQHAPVGSEIRVEVESEPGQLIVTVLDTGPGIPAELRRDLFSRPTPGARSRRPDGSGLGLLVVQRLLQQHGCAIRLVERAGFGAAFRFNLPAVPAR